MRGNEIAIAWDEAEDMTTTKEESSNAASIRHTECFDSHARGPGASVDTQGHCPTAAAAVDAVDGHWGNFLSAERVCHLNAYELIGAPIRWFLSIEGLNMCDIKAFLEHLECISFRVMHNDFTDSTHVEYELAVRKLAESIGFEAFSQAHTGMSVEHYGAQNMNITKGPYSKHFGEKVSKQRKTFFQFGCPRSKKECGYPHACSKCYCKSYYRADC